MEKEKRLEIIRQLISNNEIGSQQELIEALKKERVKVTQSTLSRDLRDLRVSKVVSHGKSVYKLATDISLNRTVLQPDLFETMQTSGFLSLRFSGNMGVVRTKPGYSSSIASEIDQAMIPSILGTIAGDDTILLILAEGSAYKDVKAALAPILYH